MQKTQILVVEDESLVAKDIQNTLQRLNYFVPVIVHSAEEAIEIAAKNRPDLVLMDIVLKGLMDGVEAAKQIRSRFDIPVIYLTAYADEHTLQRAKVTGPFGYILKPFEERNLPIAIEMGLYKHKMEKQLKESRQWFITTLKSIGDAVIATDTRGCVTFINPVAQSFTGWDLDDALGKSLAELIGIISEEMPGFAKNLVTKVLREGIIMNLANYTFISRNGTATATDVCVAPIIDDRENITGMVWAFRDISERREMEERLREVVEEKSNFVSMVSHELRTPLTAIKEGISIVTDGAAGEVNQEQREFLGIVERNVDRLGRLINDILDCQKLESGSVEFKMEKNNLNEILKEIQETMVLLMKEKGINFIVKLEENLPDVIFDKDKITQVLMNLVNNAVKFTDKGSIIISTVKYKDFIRVSVEDTGIGIEKENMPKLFHKFEQLGGVKERKVEGTGLGLAISREIIIKHRGMIWAESEPGKGTIFYFSLPVKKEERE